MLQYGRMRAAKETSESFKIIWVTAAAGQKLLKDTCDYLTCHKKIIHNRKYWITQPQPESSRSDIPLTQLRYCFWHDACLRVLGEDEEGSLLCCLFLRFALWLPVHGVSGEFVTRRGSNNRGLVCCTDCKGPPGANCDLWYSTCKIKASHWLGINMDLSAVIQDSVWVSTFPTQGLHW